MFNDSPLVINQFQVLKARLKSMRDEPGLNIRTQLDFSIVDSTVYITNKPQMVEILVLKNLYRRQNAVD